MVSYEVRVAHSAEKDLGNLSKSVVPVLWVRIKSLADEPRPRQELQEFRHFHITLSETKGLKRDSSVAVLPQNDSMVNGYKKLRGRKMFICQEAV